MKFPRLEKFRKIEEEQKKKPKEFKAIVRKLDEGYEAEVPRLGLKEKGRTEHEALINLKRAFELFIEELAYFH